MIDNNILDENIVSLINTLGNELMHHINDLEVNDILLNSDSKLWIKKGNIKTFHGTINNRHASNILQKIAHLNNLVINNKNPILTTQVTLPIANNQNRKIRVQGFAQPVSNNASFAFRLHSNILFTLDDYINKEALTIQQKSIIENAIINRKNIIIAGEQGSGKTTLANAILAQVAMLTPDDRCIILQDTLELVCNLSDTEYLSSSDTISLNDLVMATLRISSDRIIIGEIRSGIVALEVLKACNTGSSGLLSTIHADSAQSTVERFQEILLEVTQNDMSKFIQRNLDLIIYIENKKVVEILEI